MTNRELDALVAEKVMGCKIVKFENLYDEIEFVCGCVEDKGYVHFPHGSLGLDDELDTSRLLPKYSTDIAAAWQVVEKMAKKYELIISFNYNDSSKYCNAIL